MIVANAASATVRHDVKNLALAVKGKKRILWADADMPVLAQIRERFAQNANAVDGHYRRDAFSSASETNSADGS